MRTTLLAHAANCQWCRDPIAAADPAIRTKDGELACTENCGRRLESARESQQYQNGYRAARTILVESSFWSPFYRAGWIAGRRAQRDEQERV